MQFRLIAAATATGAALIATTAAAQQPPTPPPAIPNPRYETLTLEIDVARPAAQVWARVGKYCDIAEWFRVSCAITSGADGQLGAVRVLNGTIIEPLVAMTDLSYVYTQPVRAGVPFNAYHGSLEAKPVTATTSKLVYSMFWDRSMLDDAAAKAAADGRRTRFTDALKNMKILAEGGTMPPPAPPAR
jgi:hypothetical protein